MVAGRRKGSFDRKTQFALYIGDDIQMIGNKFEIAEKLGITPRDVCWFASPTAHRRYDQRKKHYKGRFIIRLEEDEDE